MKTRAKFDFYASLDPRLAALEKWAAAEAATVPEWRLMVFWSREVKARLSKIVGFMREIPGEPEFEVVRMECGLIRGEDLVAAGQRQRLIRQTLVERMPPDVRELHEQLSTPNAYDAVYKHLLEVCGV